MTMTEILLLTWLSIAATGVALTLGAAVYAQWQIKMKIPAYSKWWISVRADLVTRRNDLDMDVVMSLCLASVFWPIVTLITIIWMICRVLKRAVIAAMFLTLTSEQRLHLKMTKAEHALGADKKEESNDTEPDC